MSNFFSKALKTHWRFFLAVLIVSSTIFFLSTVSPENIVNFIGEENVYMFVFVFAMIGGVSFLSATSFYATVAALAVGGANPFILAFVSAPGILIGDMVFWYLGIHAKKFADDSLGVRLQKFSQYLRSKPNWLVFLVVYIYTGFTPLPGDILMVALAITGYRFKQIAGPVVLGNFTLVLLVGLSAVFGFPFINSLF